MTPLPEILTVDQLAAELGRNRRWIYRQVEEPERKMPCFKIGRGLYFDRQAVAVWLDSQRAGDWPTPESIPEMREPDLCRTRDSRDITNRDELYQSSAAT